MSIFKNRTAVGANPSMGYEVDGEDESPDFEDSSGGEFAAPIEMPTYASSRPRMDRLNAGAITNSGWRSSKKDLIRSQEREDVRVQRDRIRQANESRRLQIENEKLAKKARNAAIEKDFQSRGVVYDKDEFGDFRQKTDPLTGKPLFREQTGPVEYGPKGVRQRKMDREGNISEVDPDANAPIGENKDDPSDEFIYRQNNYQPWEAIDPQEGLKSGDPRVVSASAKALHRRELADLDREIDDTGIRLQEASRRGTDAAFKDGQKEFIPGQTNRQMWEQTVKENSEPAPRPEPKSGWFGGSPSVSAADEQKWQENEDIRKQTLSEAQEKIRLADEYDGLLSANIEARRKKNEFKKDGPGGFFKRWRQQQVEGLDTDGVKSLSEDIQSESEEVNRGMEALNARQREINDEFNRGVTGERAEQLKEESREVSEQADELHGRGMAVNQKIENLNEGLAARAEKEKSEKKKALDELRATGRRGEAYANAFERLDKRIEEASQIADPVAREAALAELQKESDKLSDGLNNADFTPQYAKDFYEERNKITSREIEIPDDYGSWSNEKKKEFLENFQKQKDSELDKFDKEQIKKGSDFEQLVRDARTDEAVNLFSEQAEKKRRDNPFSYLFGQMDRSIKQFGDSVLAFTGLGMRLVGAKDAGANLLLGALANDEEIRREHPRVVESLFDIESPLKDPAKSFNQFATWSVDTFIDLAPMIAESAATAIIGGVTGGIAGGGIGAIPGTLAGIFGRGALKSLAKKEALKLGIKKASREELSALGIEIAKRKGSDILIKKELISMGQKLGAMAGMYAGSYRGNTSEIYMGLAINPDIDPDRAVLASILWGIPAAALDVVGEWRPLTRMLGLSDHAASEMIRKGLSWKKRTLFELKELGITSSIEAGTEGYQTVNGWGAERWVKHGFNLSKWEPITDEEGRELVDSIAAGGIGGLGFGGLGKGGEIIRSKFGAQTKPENVIRPEHIAAIKAQIDAWTPPEGMDGIKADIEKSAARGAIKIISGESFENLNADEKAALGKKLPNGSARFENVGGKTIITEGQLHLLRELASETNHVPIDSEEEARKSAQASEEAGKVSPQVYTRESLSRMPLTELQKVAKSLGVDISVVEGEPALGGAEIIDRIVEAQLVEQEAPIGTWTGRGQDGTEVSIPASEAKTQAEAERKLAGKLPEGELLNIDSVQAPEIVEKKAVEEDSSEPESLTNRERWANSEMPKTGKIISKILANKGVSKEAADAFARDWVEKNNSENLGSEEIREKVLNDFQEAGGRFKGESTAANYSTDLDYWINNGYSPEEAQVHVQNAQAQRESDDAEVDLDNQALAENILNAKIPISESESQTYSSSNDNRRPGGLGGSTVRGRGDQSGSGFSEGGHSSGTLSGREGEVGGHTNSNVVQGSGDGQGSGGTPAQSASETIQTPSKHVNQSEKNSNVRPPARRGGDREIREGLRSLGERVRRLNDLLGLKGKKAVKIVEDTVLDGTIAASLSPDGEILIHVNPSRVLNEMNFRFDTDKGDAPTWFKSAQDEEVIHVADLLSKREEWEAKGEKGSAFAFWKKERSKDLQVIEAAITNYQSTGNLESAQQLAAAIINGYSNYVASGEARPNRKILNLLREAKGSDSIATAKQLLKESRLGILEGINPQAPMLDWRLSAELIRSIVQVHRDGHLTETAYRNIIGRLLKWMKRVVEVLRQAGNFPEIQAITKRIEEILDIAEGKGGDTQEKSPGTPPKDSGTPSLRSQTHGPSVTISMQKDGQLTQESKDALAKELGIEPDQIGLVETLSHRGKKYRTVNVLIEAEDLNPSHDAEGRVQKDYPLELQPRDRSSAVYELQQAKIAKNPDLDEDAKTGSPDSGVPIMAILADGRHITLIGNGRAIAKQIMYSDPSLKKVAESFKDGQAKRAGEKGLSEEAARRLNHPVAVRVIIDPMSGDKLLENSQESNRFSGAATNSVEQAKADAARLTFSTMQFFDSNYEIGAGKNREFRRAFVNEVLGGAENITDAELERRIELALFAKTYGASPEGHAAFLRLAGEENDLTRSITQAMFSAAPELVSLQSAIEKKNAYPLDIAQDISRAAQDISHALTNKPANQTAATAIDAMAKQTELFDDASASIANLIQQFLVKNRRSKARILEGFRAYVNSALLTGDPSQPQLIEMDAPTKEGVWKIAMQALEAPVEDANTLGASVRNVQNRQKNFHRLFNRQRSGEKLSESQKSIMDRAMRDLASLVPPDSGNSLMSGTHPRKNMPQISSYERGRFSRWLLSQGIGQSIEIVSPDTLKASQKDTDSVRFDNTRKKMKERTRAVLVSQDNYVLDGHHQWEVLKQDKAPVSIVRIHLPREEALKTLKDFNALSNKGEGTRYETEEYQYTGKAKTPWQNADHPEAGIVNPIDPDLSPDEKVDALSALSDQNVPLVEKILSDLKERLGLEGKWSKKLPERVQAKASRPSIREEKPWHDIEHVRDGLRFKVGLNHFNKLAGIAKVLKDNGVEVIKFDTQKMFHPKEWGWRFVAFDLRMPNGQLVEFYAPVPEMDNKAVKGPNHHLFEKWRNAGELTNDQKVERSNDIDKSYDSYHKAFLSALSRMGYASEKAAKAAWDRAVALASSLTRENFSANSVAEADPFRQILSGDRRNDVGIASTNTSPLSDSDTKSTFSGKDSLDSDNFISLNNTEKWKERQPENYKDLSAAEASWNRAVALAGSVSRSKNSIISTAEGTLGTQLPSRKRRPSSQTKASPVSGETETVGNSTPVSGSIDTKSGFQDLRAAEAAWDRAVALSESVSVSKKSISSTADAPPLRHTPSLPRRIAGNTEQSTTSLSSGETYTRRSADFAVEDSLDTDGFISPNNTEKGKKRQSESEDIFSGERSDGNQMTFDFFGEPLQGTLDLSEKSTSESQSEDSSTPKESPKFTLEPSDEKPKSFKQEKTPSTGLQDFGEKIEGARKDIAPSFNREMGDEEIAKKTLSQIWPKAEIDAIEDLQTAAVAHALRSEIPSKPRMGYKLNRWVEKIKTVRGLMTALEDHGFDFMMEKMRGYGSTLDQFSNKIRLLSVIPREEWDRIGEVRNYPNAYKMVDGKEIPAPRATALVDGRWIYATNLNELAEKVSGIVSQKKAAPKMQFEVRGREKGGYYINKKGDPLHRPLIKFETTKEAFAYAKENHDALVNAWEDVKKRDNVHQDDVRNTENRPRSAQDYREGKNISPEDFQDAFGFRGVQFGNWVSQGKNINERHGMLNAVYDAFRDLADVLNFPTRALSLNGQLGIALGARGKGSFSAHFEPTHNVINLTKTKGAGSLAHEWFHALDFYFHKFRKNAEHMRYKRFPYATHNPGEIYMDHTGTILAKEFYDSLKSNPRNESYLSNFERVQGMRPEMEAAFLELVGVLNRSPMAKRANTIDKGKDDGYWSRVIERAARAFENYTIHKMTQKGFHNDYLANVKSVEDFTQGETRYPYLLDTEIAPIAEAFDNLFSAMKIKEDPDTRTAVLYSGGRTDKGQGSRMIQDSLIPESDMPFNLEGMTGGSDPFNKGVLETKAKEKAKEKAAQEAQKKIEDNQAFLFSSVRSDDDFSDVTPAQEARAMKDALKDFEKLLSESKKNIRRVVGKQKQDTRKQYQGTPMWRKAPNGKESNLTEDQWLTVRTPLFKQWFGDWEALATDAEWKKAVSEYYKNPVRRQPLNMGKVSAVLLAAGISDAHMVMPPSVISKATGGKHDLSREIVEQIPASLRDPIFVFDSASEADAVTVLTELRSNGKNVLAAIHLDRKVEHHTANVIVSIYDKPASSIQNWIKAGLLRYAHQQKARDYFRSARLQLPREGSKAGNKTLLTEADVVNRSVNPDSVSKVIDENGEPMPVYHGTPSGGFDTFMQIPTYFDESKEGADVYQSASASSIRSFRADGNPQTYAVFLNARNPFDTRIPEHRRIFEEEFYGKSGEDADTGEEWSSGGTPIGERGLPDWTDGRDLADWINITKQPYDAVRLDEGGFPQEDGSVKLSGTSWMIPNPKDHIKSATDNISTFSRSDNMLHSSERRDASQDKQKTPSALVKENAGLPVTIANEYRNIPGVEPSDVLQQARVALIKAGRAYPSSSTEAPFGFYAGRAIRNELNSLYGRQLRIAQHEETSLDASITESGMTRKDVLPDPREKSPLPIEKEETGKIIEGIIRRLPERPQAIVRGFMEGKTGGEIARELGVSRQAVNASLRGAMGVLRQQLDMRGLKGHEEGILYSGERKPDKSGIHLLSKPQRSQYSSLDDKINDPASILESIVSGSESSDPRQPWKHGRQIASHTELLSRAGIANQRYRSDSFAQQEPLGSGGEHTVFLNADGSRVFKLTKPGMYGAQAEDAGAYLQRLALSNRVFGDDIRFEGFVTLPGEEDARAVISQPFIKGRDATPEEIKSMLRERGFVEADNAWVHPVTGIAVWDALTTPGNAIHTPDGQTVPIDFTLRPATDAEIKKAVEESGVGRDSLFAGGRIPPKKHEVSFNDRGIEGFLNRGLRIALEKAIASPAQWTGKKIAETLAGTTVGEISDAFWHKISEQWAPQGNKPAEVAALHREARIAQDYGGKLATEWAKLLHHGGGSTLLGFQVPERANIPGNRKALWEALTGEREIDSLSNDLQPVARKVRKVIDNLGKRAVDAGLLDKETYERGAGHYLPRLYAPKELEDRGILGLARRVARMNMDRFKPRLSDAFAILNSKGEPINYEGKKWRFNDAYSRDVFYNQLMAREVAKMVRAQGGASELTPSDITNPDKLSPDMRERILQAKNKFMDRFEKNDPWDEATLERMGQIKEAAYPVGKAILQLSHDIAMANLFRQLAANSQWVRNEGVAGFSEMPSDPRWGALAGKWVRDDIIGGILETREAPNIALKIYDFLMSYWKKWKTVYNPSTHGRNLIGNTLFADLAGVSWHDPRNWKYYSQVVNALRGKHKNVSLQELWQSGVLSGDWTAQELKNILFGVDIKGKPENILTKAWNNTVGLAGQQAQKVYQLEDQIFKVAAYLKVKDHGFSSEEAASHVRKWFPDYGEVPKTTSLKWARRGFPFLSFFYEAIRIAGVGIAEKPATMAKWAVIPALITLYSLNRLGVDDDDDKNAILKAMRGKLFGFPVFSALMPFKDSQNRLVQFDLTNIIPYAQPLGLRLDRSEERNTLWQDFAMMLLTSNPVSNLLAAAAFNQDAFTGKELEVEGMTPAERWQTRGDFIARTALPPLTPGVGSTWKTLTAPERQRGTLQKRDQAQSLLRGLAGLDLRSAQPPIWQAIERFQKNNGYSERASRFGETAVSRSRQRLYQALINDDMEGIAKELRYLTTKEKIPLQTASEIRRFIMARHPYLGAGRIKSKDGAAFLNSLSPIEKESLNQTMKEFRNVFAIAPRRLNEARKFILP